MEKQRKTGLIGQCLTALLLFGAIAHAEVCCERMDGNNGLGEKDTSLATGMEGRLDLFVDSTRTSYDPITGWHTAASIRVLAKHPVDTAVFFDILPRAYAGYRPWLGPVSFAGAGFSDSLLITDGYGTGDFLKAGDTLKDVFTIKVTSALGRAYYGFSGVRCKFLSPGQAPFPIGEALRALEKYMDSTGTALDEYFPGHLKLGPVFTAVPGDPGLLVTASADGNAWIIRYQTGGGDCPAGCTEHDETLYRVDYRLKVEVLSSRHFFALCWVPDFIPPRTGVAIPLRPRSGTYTPEGRRLKGDGGPQARLPWFNAP